MRVDFSKSSGIMFLRVGVNRPKEIEMKTTVDKYITVERHDKAVVHRSRQIRRARRNRHFKQGVA